MLLSKLINVDPDLRPTADKVKTILRGLVSYLASETESAKIDASGEPSSLSFEFDFERQWWSDIESTTAQTGNGIIHEPSPL